MKHLLVCHSRCGTTSIYKSLIKYSPKDIVWGVDKKGWDYDQFLSNNYYMARCNTLDNSFEDLVKLTKESHCTYIYRENLFYFALSLCIGYYKPNQWQPETIKEDYSEKITIDKEVFLKILSEAREKRAAVLDLHKLDDAPIYSYESIYSGEVDILKVLNDRHVLRLAVDEAKSDLNNTGKMNDYSNIENFEEVIGWHKDI